MIAVNAVLSPEDVERVRQELAGIEFQDGRTAGVGAVASKVKQNTQAPFGDPRTKALAEFVRKAFERSEVFSLFARPARWSELRFARYAQSDAYGTHLDNAIMPAADGGRMRSDLAFTLFLADPGSYEGGELVLEGLDGSRRLKLPAGSAYLYSTGVPHRVEAVTRGERLVCVGWVQSLLRRPDQRELVFDLDRASMMVDDRDARILLDKSIGALLRLWAEP